MLDCKKIQADLGDYVDGALTPDAAWRTRMHLASCAVCAQAARELQSTVALLQSLPRQETSAGFEQALARRLADVALRPRPLSLSDRARDWWTRSGTVRRRPAALAAAGALAALAPAAFLGRAFVQHGNGSVVTTDGSGTPPATMVRAGSSAADFVQQCLDEHSTYAAADPLGDQTAVILASTSGGPAEAAPRYYENDR